MSDPTIFTTPSRKKVPVSRDLLQDLSSPVGKEAWYREAASIEQKVLNLLSLFERDQISKEEYLHRMNQIFRPSGSPAPEELIQEGGTDPWGAQKEGLFFTPKFGEWAMGDFQEWLDIGTRVERLYRLKFQEMGLRERSKTAIEDPLTFNVFRQHHFPDSTWALGMVGYTMGAVESPRTDFKVLVPKSKDAGMWSPRDAETREEFMAAYREAWTILGKVSETYMQYLEDLG